MITNGSASLEDGRVPHGFPQYFGETVGESESIHPGTMVSTPEVTVEDREAAVAQHDRILNNSPVDRSLVMYTDQTEAESRAKLALLR